jgi:hypothetical protein
LRHAELSSLLADLSRGRQKPVVRLHDRTHVEFAIDYRLASREAAERFQWEAYYFVPESLRLDRRTYDKSDVYADLQSYVRFEVPNVELGELADAPVDRVARALNAEQADAEAVLRELRLFACEVRAAGVEVRQRIFDALDRGDDGRFLARREAERLVAESTRLTTRFRAALADAGELAEPMGTAARWVDEDVSRLLETLLASVARRLSEEKVPEELTKAVADGAIAEAQYRLDSGIGGVGRVGMKRREIEALEFRRHLLKRFTSSVLWLSPEVRPAATWVLQFLYAMAAGVAMAFALAAAFWNGFDMRARGVMTWVVVGVLAYAVKDRIKATLQGVFSGVVDRHFPDRRWVIRDRERKATLGKMREQAGFIAFKDLPKDVLALRRVTRQTQLEEQARPETVLFHKKRVDVYADHVNRADSRFTALTEIVRLDLRRWLAHTDDPKREIVFADPTRGVVNRADAPRVYNIAIVYRLHREGEEGGAWHRARVVVTRKGIRRIEPIA